MVDRTAIHPDEFYRTISGIRRRPAMYVGGTCAQGLMHYWRIALDFCLDEFRFGGATEIQVTLHRDGSVTCSDNGDGIDVSPTDSTFPVSRFERGFVELSCSPALRQRLRIDPCVGGDLVIINALSDVCLAETRWGNQVARLIFAHGKPVEPMALIDAPASPGFRITFRPDPEIFAGLGFEVELLVKAIGEQAVLAPGVCITFCNEFDGRIERYRFPHGVAEFVRNECSHEKSLWTEPLRVESRVGLFRLDVAINFERADGFRCCSFANGRSTLLWGAHVDATRRGLATALRRLLRVESHANEKWPINRLLRGAVIAVAVDLPDAQFEGPTRNKLANHEIEGWIREFVSLSFGELLGRRTELFSAWRDWIHQNGAPWST